MSLHVYIYMYIDTHTHIFQLPGLSAEASTTDRCSDALASLQEQMEKEAAQETATGFWDMGSCQNMVPFWVPEMLDAVLY